MTNSVVATNTTNVMFFLLTESDIMRFISHDFEIPVSKRNAFPTLEKAQEQQKKSSAFHLKILKLLRNGGYSIIDR